MEIIATKLPGVVIIEPQLFSDGRGYFQETFNSRRYSEAGIPGPFVQDNHSRSVSNVLRGLHYQRRYPQGKLVRVSKGEVFDVAADIDPQSSTYKMWVGVHLSEENGRQLYVPPGFAHGFLCLSDQVDLHYKCTDYYHPEDEAGVRWDDPLLAIEWPDVGEIVISEKDQKLPYLQ